MRLRASGFALIFAPIVLVGCDSGPFGDSLSFRYQFDQNLEPTSIEIDGETYVIKRKRFIGDGPNDTYEAWAIVVDGVTVSCNAPSRAACEAALKRHEETPQDDGDMY